MQMMIYTFTKLYWRVMYNIRWASANMLRRHHSPFWKSQDRLFLTMGARST